MKSEKILIVEDDGTTASIIALHLENIGYQDITIVTTSEDAILSAKNSNPDVVLLSIMPGHSIDGITAAQVIIDELEIPVIYVSAFNDDNLLHRVRMTNHSGFINKPIREDDLKTTISFATEGKNKLSSSSEERQEIGVSELTGLYKLTKSECRIVDKLLKNPDVKAVSLEADITLNTLRTHLKRIYKKTQTKSKAEMLVKVMNTIYA